MFGPEDRSAAAVTQPLSAGFAAAVASKIPAAAPVLAPAAVAKPTPSLAPAASPTLAPGAPSALALAAGTSGTQGPATLLQALAAAQRPRPPGGGAPISLQASAFAPQAMSPGIPDVAAPVLQSAAQPDEADAKIASNWAAIANNWSLLGQAASGSPPRRRTLLGDLVPLTSAKMAPALLTQRPAGRLAGLLAHAQETISNLVLRRRKSPAAGGHHSTAERLTRRSLLGAFPSGMALLSMFGQCCLRSPHKIDPESTYVKMHKPISIMNAYSLELDA